MAPFNGDGRFQQKFEVRIALIGESAGRLVTDLQEDGDVISRAT